MPTLESSSTLTGFTTYDEWRSNVDNVTLVTVAAAGTVNSADIISANWRGAVFNVNITTLTGTTPSLTVTVQGKDPVSGTYYTILTTAATLNAVAFTALSVYPGITATTNVSASAILPRTFRVQTVTGGTITTIAATVSISLVV